MTITSTDTQWRYVGDGVTKDFSFLNKAFAADDIRVYLDGVRQSSGYAIAGTGETTGGVVSFTLAPAVAAIVLIVLQPGGGQQIDYVPNDAFPAESHETALDRLTVRVQAIEAMLARALVIDEAAGETALGRLPSMSVRADHALAFDASGNPTLRIWPEQFEVDAAAALATAQAARDAANAALAIANQIGGVDFPAARRITLVAGQQDYSLSAEWPGGQRDTSRYTVTIDGYDLDFAEFEILEDDRTLRLLRPVVDDPSVSTDPPELPAGAMMLVRMVAAGLTAAAYGAKSIAESHLQDASISTRTLQTGAVTLDRLAVDVLRRFVPIGSALPYGGLVWPPDDAPELISCFVPWDGRALSRAVYPELWARFGITYGSGDGSTTFNVPDWRDEFIRGAGASRAVGSIQAAALLLHGHTLTQSGHAHQFYGCLQHNPNDFNFRLVTTDNDSNSIRVKVTPEWTAPVSANVYVNNNGAANSGYPRNIAAMWIGRVL